jgi:hypothetical protein
VLEIGTLGSRWRGLETNSEPTEQWRQPPTLQSEPLDTTQVLDPTEVVEYSHQGIVQQSRCNLARISDHHSALRRRMAREKAKPRLWQALAPTAPTSPRIGSSVV